MQSFLITLFTGILAIVAVLQWLAMRQQSQHMRDGLKATRDAADAANISAKAALEGAAIQKASMQQWVGVENWQARVGFFGPNDLVISFDIVNRTSWPLTLDIVRWQVDEQEIVAEDVGNLLAPQLPHHTAGHITITNEQLETYRSNTLMLSIACSVAFSPHFLFELCVSSCMIGSTPVFMRL
jgi:hypothetical protein